MNKGSQPGCPQSPRERESESDMTATQTQTMAAYLTAMAGRSVDGIDRDTMEGQIEARAIMAANSYQTARAKLVEALTTDGSPVEWALQQYAERAQVAEFVASLWLRAHEQGALAAVHMAAATIRSESTSTSEIHNAVAALHRSAARDFVSDLGYACRTSEQEEALRIEFAKQFMR